MSRFQDDTISTYGREIIENKVDNIDFKFIRLNEVLKKSLAITIDRFYSKEIKGGETREKRDRLKVRIMDLLLPLKPYTLLNPDTIDYLSKAIFQDSLLLDFFFSLKVVFFLELDLDEKEKDSLYTKLADTIYITNGDRTIASEHILKRVSPVGKDILYHVLKDNEYMIPIIIASIYLSYSDYNGL